MAHVNYFGSIYIYESVKLSGVGVAIYKDGAKTKVNYFGGIYEE